MKAHTALAKKTPIPTVRARHNLKYPLLILLLMLMDIIIED